MKFPSDIEIAQSATPKKIFEISKQLGLKEEEIIPYGWHKAKVDLSTIKNYSSNKNGKYVLVTAITPTPYGEGKTTTAIGLTQGLGKIEKNVSCCIRQPSMGPTFNIKGGAAGGGYSQCIPMEEFNLHLNGDMHAITVAHNLIATALDTRLFHESRQSDDQLASRGINKRIDADPNKISWKRVIDLTDRSLRDIKVGLKDDKLKSGEPNPYFPRETGFDITPASEIMAILALATDLQDLKSRISRVVIAQNKSGGDITVDDLGVTGAVTTILKDALMPNLVQTLEGQPVFVHAGPFANIAHGNSSIVADKIAIKLSDYVITEAGFAADMGAEKFFDIKCRYSELSPDCVVIVATIRALKHHGNGNLLDGLSNLEKHISNVKQFGVPAVVALNAFPDDTEEDIELLINEASKFGAFKTVRSDHFVKGGEGAVELANAVVEACDQDSNFEFLYELNTSLKDKIETIAKKIYGASSVSYSELAEEQLADFEKRNYGNLPICMAKTSMSISHDPKLLASPKDYDFPIREVRLSAGAGFVYPLAGTISTMPGMVTFPNYMKIDIDTSNGKVTGLS